MQTNTKQLTSLEEEIGFMTGCVLMHLSFKRTGTGWRLFLKVKNRKGKEKVTFIDHDSIEECLAMLEENYRTSRQYLTWYDAKF